jgi:transposase
MSPAWVLHPNLSIRPPGLVLRLLSNDRKWPVDGGDRRISILEVLMRPPSEFVRDLLPEEGNRLKRLTRNAASEAKRERALICWASATKMSVQQIAALVGTDESHVRKVIHASNERGFGSLDPEARGGRPRRITAEQRARIVAVAGARPDTLGMPATRWSLKRLARYLPERQIVEISPAPLGRILAEARPVVSAQKRPILPAGVGRPPEPASPDAVAAAGGRLPCPNRCVRVRAGLESR